MRPIRVLGPGRPIHGGSGGPQYEYTGTLRFTTHDGASFVLRPGDVLLAEDTAGGGHRWELIDDQPWRRVYIELE